MFDQPLAVIVEIETAQYTAESFQARARAVKQGLVKWAEENPHQLHYCQEVEKWLAED